MSNLSVFDNGSLAKHLCAYASFLGWASKYGRELATPLAAFERGVTSPEGTTRLELSLTLSASFNFGYVPDDQTAFLVVDREEFAWLPDMPISEVVIGRQDVYVLTNGVVFDGNRFDPLMFKIKCTQTGVWRAMPNSGEVGFMCVHHNDSGYEVNELSSARFPLRVLND